ncbi:hypothetical protein LCGC14_3111340, partial [marine sediment metagenome]
MGADTTLELEVWTLSEIHEIALFVNRAIMAKEGWRAHTFDLGKRLNTAVDDLIEAHVNSYYKARRDADLAQGILQDMKDESMNFIHSSAILVNDLKNNLADLEEEADAWCDSYGAEADLVSTLKRDEGNLRFLLKSVINERDNLRECNINLTGDMHHLKGNAEYLRAGKIIADKEGTELRKDRAAVVDALQPWWDSEDTGSSDEDHALID